MHEAAWVGIGILVAVVVGLGVYYGIWVARTKRRTGAYGIVQRSRFTCPKCHGVFDYEWVPGAALTAVRLGTGRYMRCPLCRKWSIFDFRSASAPPGP